MVQDRLMSYPQIFTISSQIRSTPYSFVHCFQSNTISTHKLRFYTMSASDFKNMDAVSDFLLRNKIYQCCFGWRDGRNNQREIA